MDNHNTSHLTLSHSDVAGIKATWFLFGLFLGLVAGVAATWGWLS